MRKKKAASRKPAKAKKAKHVWTLADVRRRCTPELLEVVEELRQLIRDTVPNVEERVYSEGKAIGYHVPGVGARFLLWLFPDRLAVVFAYGSLIPDPNRLLEGAEKYKSRWVTLRPGQEIPHEGLTRLILAKAYEHLGKLEKAQSELETALKLDPGDVLANLALATVLMKRDDEGAYLARAGKLIAAVSQRVTPEEQVNYDIAFSYHAALTGDAATAEKLLRRVLALDEKNERAANALKALAK